MGEIQREVEEGKRDWEKKCMMATMAPLIAGLMISNRIEIAVQEADPNVAVNGVNDWLNDAELVTRSLELYDELEKRVIDQLTIGEPNESRSGTSKEND